ncbi:MAG: hypothetical protein KAQ77_12485, partial [Candidatus Heimdallarchaeota archaeon]|nr:hypothetical protein [Candidatus Heimdallarchaeota archaeon]
MLSIGIQSNRKRIIIAIFISITICSSTVNKQNIAKADSVIWLNLVLKTNGGGVRPVMALYIADYL